VLGEVAFEGQLFQNALFGAIDFEDLLALLGLTGQSNEIALGANFDRSLHTDLAENHDVVGAFHNVADLIAARGQKMVGNPNLLTKADCVAIGNAHRILTGRTKGNQRHTYCDDENVFWTHTPPLSVLGYAAEPIPAVQRLTSRGDGKHAGNSVNHLVWMATESAPQQSKGALVRSERAKFRSSDEVGMRIMVVIAGAAVVSAGFLACSGTKVQSGQTPPPGTPVPDHVVVVIEENHSFSEIIGSAAAPYINSLAAQGAVFTQSFAVAHPSQPNYLALFSGSTQGITDDSCPHTFSGSSLESELTGAGKSFAGYSEGLPLAGSATCNAGEYARKHAPWIDFSEDQPSDSQPFSSFPTNFSTLPVVSFVIPNLADDMHDGTIQEGDTWLKNNVSAYANWAMTNNSVLIATWDEDDGTENNQIPTIIVGADVRPGQYSEPINHYSVLRTIENLYGLPALGSAANATPITDVWR